MGLPRHKYLQVPVTVPVDLGHRTPPDCVCAGVAHDVDPTTMHQLAEGSPGPFWAAMERRYGPNKNLVGGWVGWRRYLE